MHAAEDQQDDRRKRQPFDQVERQDAENDGCIQGVPSLFRHVQEIRVHRQKDEIIEQAHADRHRECPDDQTERDSFFRGNFTVDCIDRQDEQ